jgi:hypothetical protein
MRTNYFCILLLLFFYSCQNKTSDFEIVSFQNHFEFKEKHNKTLFVGLDPDIVEDARLLNINLKLKNLTGEKIESAKIRGFIDLKFKSGERKINLTEHEALKTILYSNIWKEDEMLNIYHNFVLNESTNFNPNIFEHKPDKVVLNLFLETRNSVGYHNIGEKIIEQDITSTWSF